MSSEIVSSSELGKKCWSASRFLEEQRCPRWNFCTYPEKATCRTRVAEIKYHQRQGAEYIRLAREHLAEIERLKSNQEETTPN